MSTEFDEARKQLEDLIGSRAELVISSGLYKGSYASRLEEVENGLIGMAHPTMGGAYLPALRNTELLLKIDAPNCFYQAVVAVVRATVNASLPILWLKLVTSLEKVQRRMFVRVECSIKASALFLERDEPLVEEIRLPEKNWFPVRVSDISLGGMGIAIKPDMAGYCLEGSRYLLWLTISGTGFFLAGKLVKIFKRSEVSIDAGLAYEGLTAFIERLMGAYIRQQELITRG